MNTNNFFGYGIAFLIGLAVGVLAALFLAPASGEETRSQIREKAGVSSQQIKAGYEQSRQWVTDQTGKLNKNKPAEAAPEI